MLDKINPKEIKSIVRSLKSQNLSDYILLEASGNIKEAEHEIKHWFSPEEIHDYKASHDFIYYGEGI